MVALERKLAPAIKDTPVKDNSTRVLGFVSAGLESQDVAGNPEDIELPNESESEDEDKVEIAQKDVPDAVFGGLVKKSKGAEAPLGALERIKRQKCG
ncbi:hypothetical protein Dimus_006443 [Dionaea muscipula]